jgi:hypothetical protein
MNPELRIHTEALYRASLQVTRKIAYRDLQPGDVIIVYFNPDVSNHIAFMKELSSQQEYVATVFYEPDIARQSLNISIPGIFRGKTFVPKIPVDAISFMAVG